MWGIQWSQGTDSFHSSWFIGEDSAKVNGELSPPRGQIPFVFAVMSADTRHACDAIAFSLEKNRQHCASKLLDLFFAKCARFVLRDERLN